MGAETLAHVGFDGFDGFLENLSDVTESTLQVQPQQPTEGEEKLKCEEDGEENQQYPSNPAQSDISAFTNPTQVIEQSNIPDSPPAETITTEDAEKIRDIAEVWWLEYHPDQLQNLLTQMFGWKSPGNKYKVATIENWLEGESETVRTRISELLRLRNNS